MCAVVTQALLEASANMCNSATSQFELKLTSVAGLAMRVLLRFLSRYSTPVEDHLEF